MRLGRAHEPGEVGGSFWKRAENESIHVSPGRGARFSSERLAPSIPEIVIRRETHGHDDDVKCGNRIALRMV